MRTAEALLRLNDDRGEPVPPAEFIPLAEETGSIVELSWKVLEMACRFFQRHPEGPPEAVSLNFSAQQFLERDAVSRILGTLERYGVPPARVKLELTERVLAEDNRRVSAIVKEPVSYTHLDVYKRQ